MTVKTVYKVRVWAEVPYPIFMMLMDAALEKKAQIVSVSFMRVIWRLLNLNHTLSELIPINLTELYSAAYAFNFPA